MSLAGLKKRLGDILVEVGIITSEQLSDALEIQKRTGGKLGAILSQMGAINEEVMLAFLGKQCGVSYISLSEYGVIPQEVIHTVPKSIVRRQNLIPVRINGQIVTVAMADPFNIFAIDDIKLTTGLDVQVVIALDDDIKKAIDTYYAVFYECDELSGKEMLPDEDIVNYVLSPGVKAGSSAVYIEPQEETLRIRYRTNGMLEQQSPIPRSYYSSLSSKLKSLAGLSAAAPGTACKGFFKLTVSGIETTIHISFLPTIAGDRIVLKLSRDNEALRDLNQMGFEPETVSVFIKNLEKANGMIVITGPNDSGKTSTLYAAIHYLNHPDCNIMTIEERIESLIPGVNQIQTEPEKALTAAGILRSLKVQDPDVLMIEELSDPECAAAAISASLTDKLVLTALPTSTINETLTQFYYLGVDPAVASQGISMIVNQRLIRTLCPKCKEAYEIPGYNLISVGVQEELPEKMKLFKPKGCPFCHHSGYSGRTAVHELYEFDKELRRSIAENPHKLDSERFFTKHRILSLHEAVWRKVKYGVADVEELLKITRN